MIGLTIVATVLVLFTCGAVLEWHAQQRRRRAAVDMGAAIEQVVMLIQGVQKHRGLGSQQAGTAMRQRELLAYQLDRQWADWLRDTSTDCSGSHAMARIAAQLHVCWLHLRTAPQDFDAHSDLIERLLTALALLERQLGALAVQAPPALTANCRDIEDLARLRGLSARAAHHAQCPIELAVPLRYLCQRVASGELQACDPSVRMALKEIEQKLLDAPRVLLAPARCFELLTPSIDRALDCLRQSFVGQSTWNAAPVRREAIAPLLPQGATLG